MIDLDILGFDGRCVTDPEHGLIVPHPRFHERRFALEPVAELDPGLLPWRNCSDLRVEVSVVDLLATVADQEVLRVGGPDWADPVAGGSASRPSSTGACATVKFLHRDSSVPCAPTPG